MPLTAALTKFFIQIFVKYVLYRVALGINKTKVLLRQLVPETCPAKCCALNEFGWLITD